MDLYHISNSYYKDIRPLNFQRDAYSRMKKLIASGMTEAAVRRCAKEINFFFNKPTRKHIETMIEVGFKTGTIKSLTSIE